MKVYLFQTTMWINVSDATQLWIYTHNFNQERLELHILYK